MFNTITKRPFVILLAAAVCSCLTAVVFAQTDKFLSDNATSTGTTVKTTDGDLTPSNVYNLRLNEGSHLFEDFTLGDSVKTCTSFSFGHVSGKSCVVTLDNSRVSTQNMFHASSIGDTTVNITNGSVIDCGNGTLIGYGSTVEGLKGSGTGTVVVSGTGSKLILSASHGYINLGGLVWQGNSFGEKGTLTVESGGAVVVPTVIRVGLFDGAGELNVKTGGTVSAGGYESTANGVINVSGGTLTQTGGTAFSGGGTLNLSAGSLTSTQTGALSVSMATTNIIGGDWTFNHTNGRLNINGGVWTGSNYGGSFSIGSNGGTINLTGGTINLDGNNPFWGTIDNPVNFSVALGSKVDIPNSAHTGTTPYFNLVKYKGAPGDRGSFYDNVNYTGGYFDTIVFFMNSTGAGNYSGGLDGYSWPVAIVNAGTETDPVRFDLASGDTFKLMTLNVGSQGESGYLEITGGKVWLGGDQTDKSTRKYDYQVGGMVIGEADDAAGTGVLKLASGVTISRTTGTDKPVRIGTGLAEGRLILESGVTFNSIAKLFLGAKGTIEIAGGNYSLNSSSLNLVQNDGAFEVSGTGALDLAGTSIKLNALSSGATVSSASGAPTVDFVNTESAYGGTISGTNVAGSVQSGTAAAPVRFNGANYSLSSLAIGETGTLKVSNSTIAAASLTLSQGGNLIFSGTPSGAITPITVTGNTTLNGAVSVDLTNADFSAGAVTLIDSGTLSRSSGFSFSTLETRTGEGLLPGFSNGNLTVGTISQSYSTVYTATTGSNYNDSWMTGFNWTSNAAPQSGNVYAIGTQDNGSGRLITAYNGAFAGDYLLVGYNVTDGNKLTPSKGTLLVEVGNSAAANIVLGNGSITALGNCTVNGNIYVEGAGSFGSNGPAERVMTIASNISSLYADSPGKISVSAGANNTGADIGSAVTLTGNNAGYHGEWILGIQPRRATVNANSQDALGTGSTVSLTDIVATADSSYVNGNRGSTLNVNADQTDLSVLKLGSKSKVNIKSGVAMTVDRIEKYSDSSTDYSINMSGATLNTQQIGTPDRPLDFVQSGGVLSQADPAAPLSLFGNYTLGKDAVLRLTVDKEDTLSMIGVGEAILQGTLILDGLSDFVPEEGKYYPIIKFSEGVDFDLKDLDISEYLGQELFYGVSSNMLMINTNNYFPDEVPEPSSWALLILSCAGLYFWRRKKQ